MAHRTHVTHVVVKNLQCIVLASILSFFAIETWATCWPPQRPARAMSTDDMADFFHYLDNQQT